MSQKKNVALLPTPTWSFLLLCAGFYVVLQFLWLTETSGNGGDCAFQCLSLDSTCTALIVRKGALLLS